MLIIGILAAIALPQYTKAVERSRMAEAMQVLGDLATAQSIYFMQHNNFAADLDTLSANGDITFPSTLSKSYTITFPSAGTMKATRDGGMYDDQWLQIEVQANGNIVKTCSNDSGFATLAGTAGYGVAAS